MRAIAFLGFCALVFAAIPLQQAHAQCVPAAADPPSVPQPTICLGQSCGTIGETKIDGDNKNILACLACTYSATSDPNCPTSGPTAGQEWKAMSNNSSIVCPAGDVISNITNGVATCVPAGGTGCPAQAFSVPAAYTPYTTGMGCGWYTSGGTSFNPGAQPNGYYYANSYVTYWGWVPCGGTTCGCGTVYSTISLSVACLKGNWYCSYVGSGSSHVVGSAPLAPCGSPAFP